MAIFSAVSVSYAAAYCSLILWVSSAIRPVKISTPATEMMKLIVSDCPIEASEGTGHLVSGLAQGLAILGLKRRRFLCARSPDHARRPKCRPRGPCRRGRALKRLANLVGRGCIVPGCGYSNGDRADGAPRFGLEPLHDAHRRRRDFCRIGGADDL